MRFPRLRTVAILMAAGVGLGGCATYSPYGYGSGVSVSLGDRYYDPYYDRYYAGSRYGYGYQPYWGWHDGYYYPGSGYYVYDRYRNPYYWTDYQQRYWTARPKDPSAKAVWIDFARKHATRSGTTTQAVSSGTTTTATRLERPRPVRVERSRATVERTREARIERRREILSSDEEPVRTRRVRRTQNP